MSGYYRVLCSASMSFYEIVGAFETGHSAGVITLFVYRIHGVWIRLERGLWSGAVCNMRVVRNENAPIVVDTYEDAAWG